MENYSFRLKWDALDTFFFFSFPPLIFHFFVFPEFSFPFFISRRSHFIKLCYRLKSVWSIKGNFCDFGRKTKRKKRKSRRKLWFDGGKIFANRKQLRRRREKKQENYGEIVFFVWLHNRQTSPFENVRRKIVWDNLGKRNFEGIKRKFCPLLTVICGIGGLMGVWKRKVC